PRVPRAVDPVADDRMAHRREVDAQLMGATGLGLEAHQGRAREAFERRPACERGAPAAAVHAHALALTWMPAHGAVDGAAHRTEVTPDHGQVDLLDGPRAELPREVLERAPRARHPRHEAIEARAGPAGGYDQLDTPRDARRRGPDPEARRGAGGGAAATFEGAARVAGPSRHAQQRPSGSAGAPAGPSPRTSHDPPPSTRRARATSRAIAARSASGPPNASSPRRRSITSTTSQRR